MFHSLNNLNNFQTIFSNYYYNSYLIIFTLNVSQLAEFKQVFDFNT